MQLLHQCLLEHDQDWIDYEQELGLIDRRTPARAEQKSRDRAWICIGANPRKYCSSEKAASLLYALGYGNSLPTSSQQREMQY